MCTNGTGGHFAKGVGCSINGGRPCRILGGSRPRMPYTSRNEGSKLVSMMWRETSGRPLDGGAFNVAWNEQDGYATVNGGQNNRAKGEYAVVNGGYANEALR